MIPQARLSRRLPSQTRWLTRKAANAPCTSEPIRIHAPGSAAPKGWLFQGERLDTTSAKDQHHESQPWWKVIWLTGVDYFSTLGYQPGIALAAAGAIAPLATAILVLVTLFCALPVYSLVARRSYVGQGSIAMLENLLKEWTGKVFVLVLLGFAATDFIITITLSAADAAKHAIENPFLEPLLHHAPQPQVLLTLVIVLGLTLVFLKGFNEAIGLASLICVPYLLLTAVIIGRCLMEVAGHPSLFSDWKLHLLSDQIEGHGFIVAALLLFPKLALGLSGFETGVSVMPLVSGGKEDEGRHDGAPMGRIRNTRKLLLTAALIMSVMLLSSSFVTAMMVTPQQYGPGGEANGRVLAFLAHKYLGSGFGTLYDVSTILILAFAGASAFAGLLALIPRYLPRFGMAPLWVAYRRPLVLALFAACVVVTIVFKADVDAQGGAYATGVLVLMTSAAVAAAIDAKRHHEMGVMVFCWAIFAVFAYTLVENVRERPDGLIVASCFIAVIMAVSGISRYSRSEELRLHELTFTDAQSEMLWRCIQGKKVALVPIPYDSLERRAQRGRKIKTFYKVNQPFAFLTIRLLDNRSEFLAPLRVQVRQEDDHFVIIASQSTAVANSIAVISELMDPVSIFLTLTREPLMSQSLRYLLFGKGEIGLKVYTVLIRYWEETHDDDVRPRIFLMSE